MSKITFTEWLEEAMKKKGMTKADLARASKISAAQITRITTGEQGVSIDSVVAIAKALDILPAEVFRRAAGLISPEPEYVPFLDEWNNVFYDLTPDQREILLDVAKKQANQNKQQSGKVSSRIKKSPARAALTNK